jgi:hypothetical protein
MIKYGILGVILMLVAAAVIATFQSADSSVGVADTVAEISLVNLGEGNLEQRMAYLEDAVVSERQSRIKLEEEVADLHKRNQELAELIAAVPVGGQNFPRLSEDGTPVDIDSIREQFAERRNVSDEDIATRQIANLVEAGFDEFQAEEIMRMTEEVQMDMLNARYEATQNDERFDAGAAQLEATQNFRESLGDTDYEKYLVATNQSTSVNIRNVLESSPAQSAGLLSGDEIISYNGERVYSNNDLTRLSSSADISGNVLVEVMRDGLPTSVSMPVGPIGITSGGGRGGNQGGGR